MNIEITNARRGKWSTHVSFTADGVKHTALVYPPERASESCVFAFGARGDSCTTTHEIDNPEMLAAVTAALAQRAVA